MDTVIESIFIVSRVDQHFHNAQGRGKRKGVILMHRTAVLCVASDLVIRRLVHSVDAFSCVGQVSVCLSLSVLVF